MGKLWHISPKQHKVAECHAQKGKCPLGSSRHFSDQSEAERFAEDERTRVYGGGSVFGGAGQARKAVEGASGVLSPVPINSVGDINSGGVFSRVGDRYRKDASLEDVAQRIRDDVEAAKRDGLLGDVDVRVNTVGGVGTEIVYFTKTMDVYDYESVPVRRLVLKPEFRDAERVLRGIGGRYSFERVDGGGVSLGVPSFVSPYTPLDEARDELRDAEGEYARLCEGNCKSVELIRVAERVRRARERLAVYSNERERFEDGLFENLKSV